jgi:T-complex protein 1 subunit zeta
MLTEICVDAVLAIKPADEKQALDLHMVEIMEMQHRSEQVTKLTCTAH